jgi:hypothetical protein
MRVHRILASIVIASTLMVSACSDKAIDNAKQQSVKTVEKPMHSGSAGQAGTAGSAVREAIKKKTLPEFPAMTIGKALEGYSHFTKYEWKETRTEAGKYYIDCVGWLDSKSGGITGLKSDIARQGVDIKFVVTPDGSFGLAMISRLEAKTDGNIYSYPLEDSKAIIEKIYGNKEIKF